MIVYGIAFLFFGFFTTFNIFINIFEGRGLDIEIDAIVIIVGAIVVYFAIASIINFKDWQINLKRNAANLEIMLNNPPQHNWERYATLVSTDNQSIAVYLEHVLNELMHYSTNWNQAGLQILLQRAKKTAKDAYFGMSGEEPFYLTGSHGVLKLDKRIFYAFSTAIVGDFVSSDWHSLDLIELLPRYEVAARLERAIENLRNTDNAR